MAKTREYLIYPGRGEVFYGSMVITRDVETDVAKLIAKELGYVYAANVCVSRRTTDVKKIKQEFLNGILKDKVDGWRLVPFEDSAEAKQVAEMVNIRMQQSSRS